MKRAQEYVGVRQEAKQTKAYLWSAASSLGVLKVYAVKAPCIFFCKATLNLLLLTRSFSLDLIPDRVEFTGVNVLLWQPELTVHASLLVDSLTFVGDVSSSAWTASPRLETHNSMKVEKYHRLMILTERMEKTSASSNLVIENGCLLGRYDLIIETPNTSETQVNTGHNVAKDIHLRICRRNLTKLALMPEVLLLCKNVVSWYTNSSMLIVHSYTCISSLKWRVEV